MDLKKKEETIYVIGLMYFISAWCLTFGYFTPKWIYVNEKHGSIHCSIGLIYPGCEYNFVMNNALIMMSVGLVIKYITVTLIGLGIYFDLWKYTLFMTMLSILFGTFYPAAAVLILVSTIYVNASILHHGKNAIGYSVILCTVAGALMLIVIVCLVVYDQLYVRERTQTSKKQMNASTLKNVNTTIDSVHNGRSDSTQSLRLYKHKSVGSKISKRR